MRLEVLGASEAPRETVGCAARPVQAGPNHTTKARDSEESVSALREHW